MDIVLNPYTIGLMTSIVTELLKNIPILRSNDIYKAGTAIVVMAVGTVIYLGGGWDITTFFNVAIFSFLNYKMLVQPLAATANLGSQK